MASELHSEMPHADGWGYVRTCDNSIASGDSSIECTPREIRLFMSLRREIEKKAHVNYSVFRVAAIASQVVGGRNFWAKVKTDKGWIHVKVFLPPQHSKEAARVIEVI